MKEKIKSHCDKTKDFNKFSCFPRIDFSSILLIFYHFLKEDMKKSQSKLNNLKTG